MFSVRRGTAFVDHWQSPHMPLRQHALTKPNYETHWRGSSVLLSNTVQLMATSCSSGCRH